MKEEWINNFLQNRVAPALIAIATFIIAFYQWQEVNPSPSAVTGLLIHSYLPGWQCGTFMGFIINCLLIILAVICMLWMNKRFMFLGGMSSLYVTLFLLFENMVPRIDAQFCMGTVMALVFIYATTMLFTLYEQPANRANILIIFTLLSAFAAVQISSLFVVPIFILGIIQVRAMNFKSSLAILFGIITPYWILFGTGLVSINRVSFPEIAPIWQLERIPLYLICSAFVFVTALTAIGFNFFNLVKYRLQTRVYNGFIIILLLWSAIMLVLDSKNATAYIPTLNACSAMQISHMYSVKSSKRRYIPILAVTAICIVCAITSTIYSI